MTSRRGQMGGATVGAQRGRHDRRDRDTLRPLLVTPLVLGLGLPNLKLR